MKYCSFDNEGKINSFYDSEINTNIPETNIITITNEEWLDLAEYQGFRRIDIDTREIVKLKIPPIIPEPNWVGLESGLRNTAVFSKAFMTSAPNPWALLLSTITVTHNIDDLNFVIGVVRKSMPIDFTVDEMQEINKVLELNNFDFKLT